MNKEKEQITAEEYLEIYLKNQPLFPKYDRWIDFALSAPVIILDSHYKSAMHEYAVLFAKHHRKQMIEAIALYGDVKWDGTVDMESIENAYTEDKII